VYQGRQAVLIKRYKWPKVLLEIHPISSQSLNLIGSALVEGDRHRLCTNTLPHDTLKCVAVVERSVSRSDTLPSSTEMLHWMLTERISNGSVVTVNCLKGKQSGYETMYGTLKHSFNSI